jgi:hypothetical protein
MTMMFATRPRRPARDRVQPEEQVIAAGRRRRTPQVIRERQVFALL